MNIKRLTYYLLINVFVSACVTLAILQIWAWSRPGPPAQAAALAVLLTQAAANPGGNLPIPTGSGIIVITQVVTAPPEAFTPYPTRGIVTYRVKEGDTISGIAAYFGVSQDELMALNDMTDPNRLISGVDILIPPPPTETPIPTEGPTDTPTLTLTPLFSATPRFTATPTGPTPAPEIIISAVFGVGDWQSERIEIQLNNTGEINLDGWQVKDDAGNVFTLPLLRLRSGGQISIYTRTGEPSVTSLYWGLPEAIWQTGDTVTILDAEGRIRATFLIP
jgi:LysM repeat protein